MPKFRNETEKQEFKSIKEIMSSKKIMTHNMVDVTSDTIWKDGYISNDVQILKLQEKGNIENI
jgi:hypothetical protein